MAKRLDKNDATMDISASQLVRENRPPPPQQRGVSKNDMSMWIGNVVRPDDFAAAAKPRPKRGKLVVGIIAATALAGGGSYAIYTSVSGGSTPTTASNTAPPPATNPAPPAPASTPPVTVDAAVATTPADAATATTPLATDAVSGADPVVKKTAATKRPKATTKKKTTKKNVATSPKRRK